MPFCSISIEMAATVSAGIATTRRVLGITRQSPTCRLVRRGAFNFRHQTTKKTITLELGEGYWLVMAGEIQRFRVHQVPKTTAAVERRINLTSGA
jgi:hypothetical protein